MSQKKKLVLNPLPEQTDDYSRYEESVIRWDRIIAALIVLILVVSLLAYFLTGDQEPANSINEPLGGKAEEQILGQSQPLEQKSMLVSPPSPPTQEDLNQETGLSQLESKPEQKSVNETQPATLASIAKTEEFETNQVATKVNKPAQVESTTKKTSAKVTIHNKAITRSMLTLGIKDKEPTGTIPYVLTLPDERIAKVILFTEMNGLRGKHLYHEWYRNGVRQARVKIPVNIDKQRSHSSKYINFQMLGDWQVKVLDEKQTLYVSAEFKVVLP